MRKVTTKPADRERRLQIFDKATQRQRRRQAVQRKARRGGDRGWTRAELYESPSDRLANAGEPEA